MSTRYSLFYSTLSPPSLPPSLSPPPLSPPPPSLSLPPKMVRKVYREIISLRPPNLNRVGIQKPARLLQQSGLKEKWVRREISTFDYLIQLNTIAGRTYNDLNQYPIVS